MDSPPDIHQISARKFVDHCKSRFGWNDLSKDVVMDVGCGEHGYCGKSMLEKFPDLQTIIFIDKQPQIVSSLKISSETEIEYAVGDIERRDSIRSYEGRMTKVISTHVFHQLMEKEEAFRNVYHLLKPLGEAAVLFVTKSLIYDWLTEMLKIPKWKGVYQGHYVEDLYKSGLGTVHYKEMVEKIGFQVVECSEEKRVIPSDSDESCKESLYKMCGNSFKVSPEMLEEFKEESFQVLLKLSGRDEQGKPCYRSTELTLLLVKPKEAHDYEMRENIGS